MCRRIALLSAAGLVAAGLGCQHVGGKCDPGGHPADAVPPAITNPYPYAPAPAVTAPPPAAKDAPVKLPGN